MVGSTGSARLGDRLPVTYGIQHTTRAVHCFGYAGLSMNGTDTSLDRTVTVNRCDVLIVVVVMFDALVRDMAVMHDGRANPAQLVRGNRGTNTGAAYQDCTHCLARNYIRADRTRDVGAIDRRCVMASMIGHVMTQRPADLDDRCLQRKPHMIAAD
jgi:hypothetical protein